MTLLTFACPSRFCIASCNVSGMGPAQCKLENRPWIPQAQTTWTEIGVFQVKWLESTWIELSWSLKGCSNWLDFIKFTILPFSKFLVLVRAVLTFLIKNPGLGPGARRRVGLLAGWHGQPWQHSLRVRLTRSRSRRPGTRSGRKLWTLSVNLMYDCLSYRRCVKLDLGPSPPTRLR